MGPGRGWGWTAALACCVAGEWNKVGGWPVRQGVRRGVGDEARGEVEVWGLEAGSEARGCEWMTEEIGGESGVG